MTGGADRVEPRLTLAFRCGSRLERIGEARELAREVCLGLGMSEARSSQVELCVVEAVTNSIVHSHGRDPRKTVELRMTIWEKELEIAIHDEGTPIPAERWDRRDEVEPLDEHGQPREGGRGLFLISQLMDRVAYDPGAGGNVMTMWKQLL